MLQRVLAEIDTALSFIHFLSGASGSFETSCIDASSIPKFNKYNIIFIFCKF